MPVFTELARAKVNLTLEVLGRRPDGYHELASLVAFADFGDIVALDTDAPAGNFRVAVTGPFAGALVGDNLISMALKRLAGGYPALKLGAVQLDKRLPVAAGIGGGSADAAAALRAVRRANSDAAGQSSAAASCVPWAEIATSLGADVPVCLTSETAWMSGIGERLEPISGLPVLNAVLVNALGAVPPDKTARVFRALKAPPLSRHTGEGGEAIPPPIWNKVADHSGSSRSDLLQFMRERGNHLQASTQQVVAGLGDALTALRGTSDSTLPKLAPLPPEFVAMSGAGPTCFAVYRSAVAAKAAAQVLKRRHPDWWIVAVSLG
jgi:4-diphosphocytidyl-2-C-methyl-D-erythritol kinase